MILKSNSKMMPHSKIQQEGDNFGECGGYSNDTGDYLNATDLDKNKF